ncbi:MAG: ATP-binding protein [Planctomycetaceae bacterium]|nr:ATP-binding protein [Planctomycetaceae bacterium]
MTLDEWIWQLEESFPSRTAEGKRILESVLARLESENWFPHDIFGVHLALEEALVNAVKHGNRMDETKFVHVVCRLSPEKLYVQIRDEGPGFKLEEVPDCTDDENLEKCSGRGIMLMRNFMTLVEYNDSGNMVTMEKSRKSA